MRAKRCCSASREVDATGARRVYFWPELRSIWSISALSSKPEIRYHVVCGARSEWSVEERIQNCVEGVNHFSRDFNENVRLIKTLAVRIVSRATNDCELSLASKRWIILLTINIVPCSFPSSRGCGSSCGSCSHLASAFEWTTAYTILSSSPHLCPFPVPDSSVLPLDLHNIAA
jgi:hypothetical protein